jgi:hypothetical protein
MGSISKTNRTPQLRQDAARFAPAGEAIVEVVHQRPAARHDKGGRRHVMQQSLQQRHTATLSDIERCQALIAAAGFVSMVAATSATL